MKTALGVWPEPTRRKRASSAMTEVFFAPSGEAPDRVILFHHIQKTAGTSLRQLIRRNLRSHVRATGRVTDMAHRTRDELAAYYRDYYTSLSRRERDSASCVMAHHANFMLPLIERPVDAITVVRDPVDRVVSQFFMKRVNQAKTFEAASPELPEYYKHEHDATLVDIYRHLGGAAPRDSGQAWVYSRFFNGQSRSLLDPHFDTDALAYSEGPSADADMWRERLFTLVSERYFVGLQSRYAEFAAELEARYGWQHVEAQGKVGKFRPKLEDVPPAAVETIRAYNWLDDELHRFCASIVEARAAIVAA